MPNDERRAGRSAAWGVAAVVFAGGAIYTSQLANTAVSGFPIWPTYVVGVVATIALYMCFATVWEWWPTGRATTAAGRALVLDLVDELLMDSAYDFARIVDEVER